MNESQPPKRSQPATEKSFSQLLNEGGYFDDKGNLRVAFVERAQVDPLAREMADAGLTSTQLRRFFQHCRAIETQIRSHQTTWEQLAASFKLLDSAAERARNRAREPLPRVFYQFLSANIAAVHTEKDFLKGFLPHFEALLGFASAYLRK